VPLNKLEIETHQHGKIMVAVRIPGALLPDETSLPVPLSSVFVVFHVQCSLQLNILSTSEVFSTFASRN